MSHHPGDRRPAACRESFPQHASVPSRHIFPLCIAAGSLFAYDLFVFAEALVLRSVDVALLSVRGIFWC